MRWAGTRVLRIANPGTRSRRTRYQPGRMSGYKERKSLYRTGRTRSCAPARPASRSPGPANRYVLDPVLPKPQTIRGRSHGSARNKLRAPSARDPVAPEWLHPGSGLASRRPARRGKVRLEREISRRKDRCTALKAGSTDGCMPQKGHRSPRSSPVRVASLISPPVSDSGLPGCLEGRLVPLGPRVLHRRVDDFEEGRKAHMLLRSEVNTSARLCDPSCQAEHPVVFLRQTRRPHVSSFSWPRRSFSRHSSSRPRRPRHEDMPREPRRQLPAGPEVAALHQEHFICERHHARGGALHPRPHHHFVVESSGRPVPAMGFGHRQINSVLALHIAIIEAAGFAPFHPAGFHPHQVIGVIDDAHLVSLGVAHAQTRFGGKGHGKCIVTRGNASARGTV
jgi:hypothetical protein